MDIMTDNLAKNNIFESDTLHNNLKDYLQSAIVQGAPIYQVEKKIFSAVLQMGKQALNYFFSAQGDGDVGEKLILNSGEEITRLNKGTRYYQSIFGTATRKVAP